MKAVGYFRVSTQRQVEEGFSLNVQDEKFSQWAELNDAEIICTHRDEGISGHKPVKNRPGLKAALDLVCEVKGALVVYSLSRLARNTQETLEIADRLNKAGAHLVSITENIDTTSACGKMIFRLLAVLAEFERDQISERTQAIHDWLRTQGRKASRTAPYGYGVSGDGTSLIANHDEQAIIRLMRTIRDNGTSYAKIAQAFNQRGIPTKTGSGVWHAKTVRDILCRSCPTTPPNSLTPSATR